MEQSGVFFSHADAVAVLNLGSVALLQHHVAVVLNRHRRLERDGRLLAELALGGHAGDLVHADFFGR